jgi:hypothetical protein
MVEGTTPVPRLVPPEAAFEEFKAYVQKFDPIELLCQLTMTFLFTPEGFQGEASDTRRWARWIEFTAGYLATVPPRSEQYLTFNGAHIEEFERIILQYFHSFLYEAVNRPPGTSQWTKGDILSQAALLGIELKNASSQVSYSPTDPDPQRAAFGNRRIKELGLDSKQFLARVGFSDSHALSALGRNAQGNKRVTRIKMDLPSFEGLRIALQDSDARIRLEDEVPQRVPYLMGMKIQGGFLDGQSFHFSRNLNCIIGGRGAGKWAVCSARTTPYVQRSFCRFRTKATAPPEATLLGLVDKAYVRH